MLERENSNQNSTCANDNARLEFKESYKYRQAIKKSEISLANFGN